MVRLEQVLESWKTIRADTAAAVEEFPAGEFDYKPAADVMTFGEIARHILIAGHGLTGLLLEGDEHLGGPQFREKMARFALLPEGAGAADLARELRASVEQRAVELAARTRTILRDLGAAVAECASPIVAARFENRDVSALARALKEQRVLVAARRGHLRVSPHLYNNEQDLEVFKRALRALL